MKKIKWEYVFYAEENSPVQAISVNMKNPQNSILQIC